MSRGDVIPIDSRSHLEVADRKHRYAKNLRTYFKEYHRINGLSDIVERSAPTNENSTPSRKWTRYEPFFDWLDNEESLPNLPDCPRSVLDEDRVEYLTAQADRENYEITINGTGAGSSETDGAASEKLWRMTQTGEPVNTGSKGWIFVLLNGRMYACEKRTNTFPRFHHSSFFAGASVNAAGMLVCVNGKLTKLFPHSGHYRPHDRHLYSLLAFLRDKGVDLSTVQVDVQRVMKLSRQQDKDGSKAKKTDSAFYLDGETAYNFLKSKTGFQESGVFRHINKRRLDYEEGEQSAPVKASRVVATTATATATTPAVAGSGVSSPAAVAVTVAVDASMEGGALLSPGEAEDALGQLPLVLQKAESLDSHHSTGSSYNNNSLASPSERAKLRLSMAPASNRSSLNMNRLSLSSTGGYASTAGSTSPFCSPVAQHNLYPLHCSSSGGRCSGDVDLDREEEKGERALLASTSNEDRSSGVDAAPAAESRDLFEYSRGYDNNSNSSNKASPTSRNPGSSANDNNNFMGNGLFGSTSGDECSIEALLSDIRHKQQHLPQRAQDQFGSGGRSSADARARLLNTMLYADTTTNAAATAGPATDSTHSLNTVTAAGNSGGMSISMGRNKGIGSLPLPPSPPVPLTTVRSVPNSNNVNVSVNMGASLNLNNINGTTNYNSNGSAVYVQTGVSTPIMKIPVAAPIKKVTSYSSISSSYGSSSFALQQPQQAYYGGRSRSASKAEHDLDYDLRMLLGESPIVQMPDQNYFNYDGTAVSPVNSLGTYNQYNVNATNSNSTCNSRGRSRGSSFNPPYVPNIATAAATILNNNNASAGTSSNNNLAGSGSGSGHNTRSNSLYGGANVNSAASLREPTSTNTNANNSSNNSADSSPVTGAADKRSPRSSLGSSTSLSIKVGGGGAGQSSSNKASSSCYSNSNSAEKKAGASTAGSVTAAAANNSNVDGGVREEKEEKDSPLQGQQLLFSSDDIPIPTASATSVSSGDKSVDLPAAPALTDELCAGSPQPSFASSLSSTDSLPNMLLSYVMSPGGTTLHHCFDGQGEGDGMYEEEVLGDSYHDHLYGGEKA